MKRFLITSLCTLVLSLLGAFGLNQNTLNANASSIPEQVNQQSLTSDNQTNVAGVMAPAAENTDNNIVTNEKLQDNNEDANTTGYQNTTVKTNRGNHYGRLNRQAIIYKNVNLSNCKNAKDVVKKLQQNGYKNITMKNIQNIKSLKDILAYIQYCQSGNSGTGPVPTTVPAPTVTPAPTTAPAPTTVPAPTTTPAPTVAPAPTTAPATGNTNNSSYASEVLRLVNIERAKAGLSAYTTNSAITSAANKRAQEIKQSFSHTRTNGTGFSTALTEYGVPFRAAGENIAYGQKTPQEVVTGWMNSPGHRANILNPSFNKIGIGVYEVNGVYYWVQEFTN